MSLLTNGHSFKVLHPRLLRKYDESTLERILDQYSSKVYRLALSLVKNKKDAEDITQEVFFIVCSRIDDLKENKDLSIWIYRIAVKTSLMKTRESGRPKKVLFEEALPGFDQNGKHIRPVDDWSKYPGVNASSKEVMSFMKEKLEELPDSYKVVFLLSDVEGLSNNEVTEVLDISLKSVKSRLHRARLFMRECLSKYFEKE